MKKTVLIAKTATVKAETKTALETLWKQINKGQQKQILKISAIKVLFDRYGVSYTE